MTKKMLKSGGLVLLVVALAGIVLAPPQTAKAEEEAFQSNQNLLRNPGFEGEYRAHNAVGSIKVAPNWEPWFVEGNADEQANGYGRIAEFFTVTNEFFPGHVLDGQFAQGMKNDFGTGANGILQQVTVPANAHLRFSVMGRGYSCQPPEGGGCPLFDSLNPSYLGMQIGIDPTGGTNFFADPVVFTPGTNAYDRFEEFVVEADARGTQVTVFIMFHPAFPVRSNRVIWDSASLTATSGSGSSVSAPESEVTTPPTPTPTPTPQAVAETTTETTTESTTTTTETTSGATYSVQRGDSLARIARNNGTDVATLINLNGPTYPSLYTNPNLIYVGWVLRLSGGAPVSGRTYTVQSGDYLAKIARENGTTVTEIVNLNAGTYPRLLSNPNLLYVGWVLRLP